MSHITRKGFRDKRDASPHNEISVVWQYMRITMERNIEHNIQRVGTNHISN